MASAKNNATFPDYKSWSSALLRSRNLSRMYILVFKLAVYSLITAASAVLLAILRHRLRQWCLWKIPGPSNPSFLWGNVSPFQEF